jgi:hypothetical protein
MRPRRFTYTLAALDADGYVASANVNSVAVGAGYTIRAAATHPGDGCSHPVTITSGGDATGSVFTVTGTDAEGRTISEDITGANTGVATSTKYYADVTSVVRKSGDTGAVAITVGYTALARTPIFPVDRFSSSPAVLAVDIGGTVTYSGQCTHGDIFELASDTLQFVNLVEMAALTADSSIGVAQQGATGMRVYVASHTSGTLALTFSQAKG